MLELAVLTANRYRPSWLISTQHGAVWRSANGDEPIEVRAPLSAAEKADTVPLPAPPCAFETNNWVGFVGLNSLPKGPSPWAVYGEPGAAVSFPFAPTEKLSISDVLTRTPTSRLPVLLKSTSPGDEPSGNANVESASGRRCPPRFSVKPV